MMEANNPPTCQDPPAQVISGVLLQSKPVCQLLSFDDIYESLSDCHDVAPLAVRYRILGNFNQNDNTQVTHARSILIEQALPLISQSTPTKTPFVSFPEIADQTSFVDIHFSNRDEVEQASKRVFQLQGNNVVFFGRGSTLPPTDVVVIIRQFIETPLKSTRSALQLMVKQYNDLYCQKRPFSSISAGPTKLEIVSLWAQRIGYPEIKAPPHFTGVVVAHLRFPADELLIGDVHSISFPHEAVGMFPAYFKVLGRRYEMHYTGRQATCSFCKEYRPNKELRHNLKDCSRRKCYHCSEAGHLKASCPRFKRDGLDEQGPYFDDDVSPVVRTSRSRAS